MKMGVVYQPGWIPGDWIFLVILGFCYGDDGDVEPDGYIVTIRTKKKL